MADSWERRPVANTPGYNNIGNGVQFTVTYDSILDRLVIQSNFPVLGALDSIAGSGELPDGSPGWNFTANSSEFVIDSPSEVHIPDAWTFLVNFPGDVADVQQLDFFDISVALLGTWTGSVLVTEPVPPEPLIENYSYVDFYDTQTNPGSFISFDCVNSATADAQPSVFFYGQNLATIDGFRAERSLGGPFDYRLSTDPQYFSGGVIDDGYFLFSDPTLWGVEITEVQPLDINGDPVGDPTALLLRYNDVTSIGIDAGDTDVLEILWNTCPETPTLVNVLRCAGNQGVTYYDPLGPQAGLNPGDATIVQWDTSAILVDHASFIGAGDINRIEVYDPSGRVISVFGDPLPLA